MKKWMMILLALFLSATGAQAFNEQGCGAGKCTDCHSMTLPEAQTLLQGGVDKVFKVEMSEVPGFWMIEAEKGGQKFPLYVDFSKSYLVVGNVIRLKDKQNITSDRQAQMNRIDVGRIPLEDSLLLGKADAKTQVIVFTDPECPYCIKLHKELKEVVGRDPSIAFRIKLFPLKIHPNAYEKSKSIVCNKSMALLESSFEGKPLPPALCDGKAVDATLALAPELGIRSTPTLVLPDGLVAPGYKKADDLLTLLGSSAAPKAAAAK